MKKPKTDEILEIFGSQAPPEAVKTAAESLKDLALSPALQSLWAAVLPMVGVRASRPDEFAGYFQVEPGTAPDEALVHIDIANAPYVEGAKPAMARVVSLSVKLAHDFRRLGDQYYCIDCEVPAEETRH
jgi:hypothetical protein